MGQQHQSGERPSLATLGSDLWNRKCRGERIDALEKLPYFRLLYLRQRRAGHELAFTEYGRLLKSAMKPVPLPKLRSHVDVQADRDAAIAIRYHNAAMQQFSKALGLARMNRDPSLDTVNAQFDELFTPEHRRRAMDWANSPEGREHLAAHAEALRAVPVPQEPHA